MGGKLYPTHVPTTGVQKALVGAGAAVLGLADPRARERAARVALGPLGRAGAGRLA